MILSPLLRNHTPQAPSERESRLFDDCAERVGFGGFAECFPPYGVQSDESTTTSISSYKNALALNKPLALKFSWDIKGTQWPSI